jgi:plasmid stabilization system protein ParE
MRVRYTPRASGDLAAILRYLNEHSPQGLRNVRRAIDNTERLIGQFPQGGRMFKET